MRRRIRGLVDDPAAVMLAHLRAHQARALARGIPAYANYFCRPADRLQLTGELVVKRWQLPPELAGAAGGRSEWVRFTAGTLEPVQPVWESDGATRRIIGWQSI